MKSKMLVTLKGRKSLLYLWESKGGNVRYVVNRLTRIRHGT